MILLITACEDSPPQRSAFDDLNIQFLHGFIRANLGPVVPPDPVDCRLTMVMSNANLEESLEGLSLQEAEVILDSTDQLLGTIQLDSDWSGILQPGEQDTVTFIKLEADQAPFEPPCAAYVSLRLEVHWQEDSKEFSADHLLFECSF